MAVPATLGAAEMAACSRSLPPPRAARRRLPSCSRAGTGSIGSMHARREHALAAIEDLITQNFALPASAQPAGANPCARTETRKDTTMNPTEQKPFIGRPHGEAGPEIQDAAAG